MRKLLIISTPHILPPLAGEMEEQHEAKGGYIYLSPTPSFHSRTFSLNGGRILFSNAKSLLGQEFPYAVYDMRAENGVNFNLEALAIVAGTIQENGTLYLLCPNWDNLDTEIDFDSLRWNDGKAIATPNFWAYFKALVQKYRLEKIPSPACGGRLGWGDCNEKGKSTICSHLPNPPPHAEEGMTFTAEQSHILNYLPYNPEPIHLITAPRGRGKSTLSGKLAEQIAQDQPVIITARTKAALPNFWKQIENRQNIAFFAPDRLIQAVENQEISAKSWLFIDEAASLPLPMLSRLCAYFERVVMTTTTQNYEGTGRGFELKLPKMLNKPFQHWTLHTPLRWGENDPLEGFINDLLRLSSNPVGANCNSPLQMRGAFYDLLATAHYKTTATDLRRLFDGENQQLFDIREHQQLIAGCWAVNEGGMDYALAQAIWRGERRPAGNLVAQYLCFQGNLIEAATLHSVRISRIAVTPEKQGQGYGKRLVSDAILQISKQNAPLVDFVSVSFGMSEALLAFWRRCGFRLVQISQQPEASSGLLSAMMIYPLSERGKAFAEFAENRFERDARLQKNSENQPLDAWDWQNLRGFAQSKRTFSACETSLIRLYHQLSSEMAEFAVFFSQDEKKKRQPDRTQLSLLRQFVQKTVVL